MCKNLPDHYFQFFLFVLDIGQAGYKYEYEYENEYEYEYENMYLVVKILNTL